MDQITARTPYLDTGHECRQIRPIIELASGVKGIDEKLEHQGKLLEKLTDGLDQIRVLHERDLRREKDMEEAFKRIRTLETSCRMEDRLKEHETAVTAFKVDMRELAVKMAFVGVGAVTGTGLICTVIGALIVKHFGG